MYQAIKNFPQQFDYQPKIANEQRLIKADKFIVSGMGGSHLAADILKTAKPSLDLIIHKDYGLPRISPKQLKKTLIIFSSYSGNTEEVLDGFHLSWQKKLNMAAISVGGQLIKLAQKYKLPYIQMPDTGIQPRSALGFSLKSHLQLIGDEQGLNDVTKLSQTLTLDSAANQGRALAQKLKDKVPIIYASTANLAIAYNWKIKFNETAKIPAFYNLFPELNHNEMTGFDVIKSTKNLSEKFYFIFLKDSRDQLKIQKRMDLTQKLYQKRSLRVEILALKGNGIWQKIFQSLLIADFAAYYTAKNYGADPEQVPMVEELKQTVRPNPSFSASAQTSLPPAP